MKTTALTIAALLFAKLAAFAAIDLGTRATATPYESHMQPVKQVLHALPGQTASMERVQELMKVGRSFRYSFTEPYTPALPSVTAATKSGDCKAKSLWLVDQLGDENVRFVIGKATSRSKISHAWVMWQHEGKWWILDPTNTSKVIAADSVPDSKYIPLYSYDKNGAFRHTNTAYYAQKIAGKKAVAANDAR